MNNIIIGTAGHVDHGKTALIRALTGIDADRLKEEKKRGITIDIGFAYLTLPNGERAGIIDVPGHEKFIRNMLAGAGGIDFALFVIAADDGVMPQTREHLGILSLLDVKDGIIVLTKADMVDEDWIELVKEDVKKAVAGTFLQSAPIVSVSAHTGQGIEQLRELLFEKLSHMAQKDIARPFRIPVDRVFSVDGFGTVITGTMVEGRLSEGDDVTVYPSGKATKVRNLQVHGKNVKEAFAGQRVAVNLAGIKKEELERGDTLARPGSMENTMMLDVKLKVLPDSPRTIVNNSRLHFYHGTQDVLCKVILLDRDALEPGQEGYAQLRFTQPVAAKQFDHFVVRFYSPVETVGGGTILNPNPLKHRRNSQKILDALSVRETGSLRDNLLQAIADHSPRFTPLSEIQTQLGLDNETMKNQLASLAEDGKVILLTPKITIDMGYYRALGQSLQKTLEEYHKLNPLLAGMKQPEVRSRLLPGAEISLADKLLALYEKDGLIRIQDKLIALSGFTIRYSPEVQKIADALTDAFLQGGYAPPAIEEVADRFPKEKTAFKQVFEAMTASGQLVLTGPQIYFHQDICRDALEKISALTQDGKSFTLAEFRDAVGTSRKYALSLLEYFDRRGVTQKVGDTRVLVKR